MANFKLGDLSDKELDDIFPEKIVLLGYRGSVAYGLYRPSEDPRVKSDKDVMAVFVPPISHYFGFNIHETSERVLREWDTVSYEFRKYVGLCAKSNPNVLSLLWLKPNKYIHKSEVGQVLIDNRQLFVTRRAYHSFSGYAYDQLRKMSRIGPTGDLGEKRKALVEKFGYDVKNAAMLILLLRQSIEYLNEGILYVDRAEAGDSSLIMSIKNGEWPIEKVQAEAEHLFKRAEAAYDASKLPNAPDPKKVNELVISTLWDFFRINDTQPVSA